MLRYLLEKFNPFYRLYVKNLSFLIILFKNFFAYFYFKMSF